MSQLNQLKKSAFAAPPTNMLGLGWNTSGELVRVNADGSTTLISSPGTQNIPTIIANKGVGTVADLPTTGLVQGDIYVTNDTYKKYTRVDATSWSIIDLITTQVITDEISLLVYQFNGTVLLPLNAGTKTFQIINSATNAEPNINYLLDPTGGMFIITLPEVTYGDVRRYFFTLQKDSNHVKIEVDGGLQLIGGLLFLGMATVNGYVEIVANGVDGYYILVDGRVYDRVVNVTANLDLSSGFESGAMYNAQLTASQAVLINIPNAIEEHVGQFAAFSKHIGDNASIRIVSTDGSFDETITQNDTGFTIVTIYDTVNDEFDYVIKQDSRPKTSNIAVSFLPTDTISTIEPSYSVLETESQPEEILTSIPIISTDPVNPTSLGFWINDNKALTGTLADTDINAFAQIKKTIDFNRNAQIKFRYYRYNYETNSLGSYISETSYSSVIDDYITYEERQVGGTLPSNTWAVTSLVGHTLVIELLAIKVGSGGVTDNPTLDFRSGGTSPSKTVVNIPATNINHNTLGGVSAAGIGVPDGHVNTSYPLILPTLTTTERDAVTSPNTSMIIKNSTTGNNEWYNGTAWVIIPVEGLLSSFTFGGQAHGGNKIETFSVAKTFNLNNGNNQYMAVSANTVLSLSNVLPGTFIIQLQNTATVTSITVDSSFGDALDGNSVFLLATGDRNKITIHVDANSNVEYINSTKTA